MAKKRNLINAFKDFLLSNHKGTFYAYVPFNHAGNIYPFQEWLETEYERWFIDYYLGDSPVLNKSGGINIIVSNRPFKISDSIKNNIPDYMLESHRYRIEQKKIERQKRKNAQ